MKKTYLISYDLSIPEASEDYRRLIKRIQSYPDYATPLKSVWLIKSSETVLQVRDALKLILDENDRLLVIDVTAADWACKSIKTDVTSWMKINI